MKSIRISKPDKTLVGSISLPSSKSISNRLLVMQALSGRDISITNLSEAADTILLQRLLDVVNNSQGRKTIPELDASNAGTVLRFLTAFLALRPGKWVLTGSDRMKQRPVGVLGDALKSLGADIEYLAKPGYPPLLINGHGLSGSEVTIDTSISSQFITALLLIAPYLKDGLLLRSKGNAVSQPYTDMTIRLMQSFGARVKKGIKSINIKPGGYALKEYNVESDWSSAAFWYEAAVFAGEVDLELLGLHRESLQGDSILPEIYKNFGIQTQFTDRGIRLTRSPNRIDGFYYDFTNYPDIAQAVIATCAGLGIRGHFEGVQTLQIKETDRLRAMKREIEKLGIGISLSGERDVIHTLDINPTRASFPDGLTFESYGDHRTAMTLAPFAFKTGSLTILNPDVVVKSYPKFWDHLKSTGFEIQ